MLRTYNRRRSVSEAYLFASRKTTLCVYGTRILRGKVTIPVDTVSFNWVIIRDEQWDGVSYGLRVWHREH